MRLFVTGASGFLGGHFVRGACAAGHEVIALSRRPLAGPPQVAAASIVKDILQFTAADLPDNIDAIVHFATGNEGGEARMVQVAVEGTCRLFAIARVRAVPRFVHVSSMSVYPGPLASDPSRLDALALDPHPERRGSYTLSKTLADAALQDAFRRDGVTETEVTIVRPGLVFGPDLGGVLWGTAIELPFGIVVGRGRPRQAVPLLDVRDLTAGLLGLLAKPPRPGEAQVFDILSGTPAKEEFLRAYAYLSGQAVRQVWVPRAAALTVARALDQVALWRGARANVAYQVRQIYDFDPADLPHQRFWQAAGVQPAGDMESCIRSALTLDRVPRPVAGVGRQAMQTRAVELLAAADRGLALTPAPKADFVLVGAGRITAEMHVPALASLPSATVRAVVDPNQTLAQQVARAFPGARAYGDIRDVDTAVLAQSTAVIATPGFNHAVLARDLIGRTAALMIEKPVVLHANEFDELRDLATRHRRVVTVFQNYRLLPSTLDLWRFIQHHDVGELVKVRLVFHWNRLIREGARWMLQERQYRVLPMELAIHPLDVVCLIGGAVDEIGCLSTVHRESDGSTVSITAMARLQRGAELYLDLDTSGTSRIVQTTLEFERCAVVLDWFPSGFRVLPRRANPVDDTAAAFKRTLDYVTWRLAPRRRGLLKRMLPHRAIYLNHIDRLHSLSASDSFTLRGVQDTMLSLFRLCDRAYPA